MLAFGIRFFLFFLISIFFWEQGVSMVFASESSKPLVQMFWTTDGVFGKFDRPSIQRGLKIYEQKCSACHGVKLLPFRDLVKIGFSKEEAKSIASMYMIKDGPNDEGDMFERPGALSDYFPSPYANKQAAAAANNGAVPPDLSLIVKARFGEKNYIYSLLTGYSSGEPDDEGLYSNPYFPSGKIAMPPPMIPGDDSLVYDDGTPGNLNNYAYDVTNFLHFIAEPEMEERKSLGLKLFGFLAINTVIFILMRRKISKDMNL